jgi:hypothetical protein
MIQMSPRLRMVVSMSLIAGTVALAACGPDPVTRTTTTTERTTVIPPPPVSSTTTTTQFHTP